MRNDRLEKLRHDTEAEMWVLGSILLKPELLDERTLTPKDFFDSINSAIYREMVSLHHQGKPVHVDLLKKHLGNDTWAARAGEIMLSVPVAAHFNHYAEIVRQKATLRRLHAVGEQLINDSQNQDASPESILERAEVMLAEIVLGDHETDPVAIKDATLKAADHIDAIMRRGSTAGVMTGLYDFDHDFGGLHPGELVVLAARPGIGKTSFALQIADHASSKGKLVYFASLEMSAVELSIRLACSQSGVSNRLVRTGRLVERDKGKLLDAMAGQSENKLVIHDQAGLTVNEIKRQVRRLKKRGLTLVVVDYLQLLTPVDRKTPREQQVATMSKTLKELAREFSVPVLCLCQLNRLADGSEQPQLSHLRESGALEQDADVVLFLAPHAPTDRAPNNASLIVAKNRNGETGPLPLIWHPSETRFSCSTPEAVAWTPTG